MFRAFAVGATVCIPQEAERFNDLAGFINRKAVTYAFLTPSFCRSLDPNDVPTLKTLSLGGEAVQRDVREKWLHRGVQLKEVWGMTEGSMLVGEPTGTTQALRPVESVVWLLDPKDSNRLVPLGAVGELALESSATASGYLNDPEKSASTFIRCPKWMQDFPWSRDVPILRTGDLAQMQSDGSIKLLGRKDAQIKVNGQRVDPQEVEYQIRRRLPTQAEVVVDLVRPRLAAEASLVAFVALAEYKTYPSFSKSLAQKALLSLKPELIAGLAEVLPSFMLPRVLIAKQTLPYNMSGKIDRKKLRDGIADMSVEEFEQMSNGDLTTSKEQASTVDEKNMSDLWSEVLGRESADMSLGDDFFSLGGNSLSVIKLVGAARRRNLSLTAEAVFSSPTLAGMSRKLSHVSLDLACAAAESARDRADLRSTMPLPHDIVRENVEDIVEATDFQAWCILAGSTSTRGWLDHLTFALGPDVDISRLSHACQSLIDQHAILRTVFLVFEQKTYQVILRDCPSELVQRDAQSSDGLDEACQEVYDADFRATSLLGQRLVQFTCISEQGRPQKLVMRISHAQYDALCVKTILDHLRLAYSREKIPESPTFASFVRVSASHQHTNASLEYWQRFMDGASMPRLRQTTAGRLPYRNPTSAEVVRHITSPKIHTSGITTATVVKAAWGIVLAAITDSPDVVFGELVSGRYLTMDGIEAVLGPCMNFVPVRMVFENVNQAEERCKPNNGLAILRRVHAQYVSSLSHETVGFRHIIRHATSWPKWERFSSIVNFINESTQADSSTSDEHIQQGAYVERSHDKTDIWIMCLPQSKMGELCITVRYSEYVFSTDTIERLADLFVSVIGSISTDPDREVDLAKLGSNAGVFRDPTVLETWSATQTGSPSTERFSASGVVDEVWKACFGYDVLYQHDASTAFYDIADDHVVAVQMQQEYCQRGIRVTIEALFAQSSRALQTRRVEVIFQMDSAKARQ